MQSNQQIPPQHRRPSAPHPESYQQGQIPPVPISTAAGMPIGAGGAGQQQFYAAGYQQQMGLSQQQTGFYHGQQPPPSSFQHQLPTSMPSHIHQTPVGGYYPPIHGQQRLPLSTGAEGMMAQQQLQSTIHQQQPFMPQQGLTQGQQMFPSTVQGESNEVASSTKPTFPPTGISSNLSATSPTTNSMGEQPSSTTMGSTHLHANPTTVAGPAMAPVISPTSALEQRWAHLRPTPLPRELFSGVSAALTNGQPSLHSVETLCSLGREATNDLLNRALNAMSVAKMDVANTNRNAPINMATVLSYSKWMFQRLVEIRLLIDRTRQAEATATGLTSIATLTDEALFEHLAAKPTRSPTPTRNNDEVGDVEYKARLTAEFEANRAMLLELSAELKRLDWLAAVGEPRLIAANGLSGTGHAKKAAANGLGEGCTSGEFKK